MTPLVSPAALLLASLCVVSQMTTARGSDRPIVGVLAQELTQEMASLYPDKTSYIPASYIKALESSGARVVPVFIRRTEDYYKQIMTRINGLVFPGGMLNLSTSDGFTVAGRIILDFAEQLQDSGVSFPLLGVCQGFELLMFLAANSSSTTNILTACDAMNVALNLDFRPGFQESQLFKHASLEILDILATLSVTSNFHQYCVTESKLKAHSLEKTWRILSTNKDRQGLEFVSSSEHFQRPIVGVQFHPEKNLFEWNASQVNPHSRKAILSARHFYDWLVAQSRNNNHSFPSAQEELDSLIYNYNPEYTGKLTGSNPNEQVYFF